MYCKHVMILDQQNLLWPAHEEQQDHRSRIMTYLILFLEHVHVFTVLSSLTVLY